MPEALDTYQRQIQSWRDELVSVGKRFHAAGSTVDEFEKLIVYVRDLRVRVRKVCDELGVWYDDGESIAGLIHKIEKKTQ